MTPKRKPPVEEPEEEKRLPGRPTDDPFYKASKMRRALFSTASNLVFEQSQEIHGGLSESDLIRLALWNLWKKDGLTGQINLEEDNTWQSLIKLGLI